MCIKCGNINHFDNSEIEKGLKKRKYGKKSPGEDSPRYKVNTALEDEFKSDYNSLVDREVASFFKDLGKGETK